ncbi:MAG: peptidylprolyl isomerase [Bacteroidaceae bacterium]|nr:peptidylprolyl isomerase [Bacteroidaceae bacterium]MBR5148987.1 peptidylprolyl isomerase [Bacteroidaceae bacterium]
MKQYKLWVALCTVLMAVPAVSQDNVIDEVVWVVGDEAILKSDVEESRLYFMMSGQKMEGNPYCVIPEQLAIQKLFLHQAAIDSVEVSDQEAINEVEREMNMRISQIGSKEKMEEYFGKTSTQIREELRETVRDRMIVERMQQKLLGDIRLTPAEIRKGYAQMSSEEIPFVPTQVEVQIITQQPEIPQEEIERVKAELRDYTERVNSGEAQFSTLAVFYSQDPLSARRGGELDAFGRGEMVPEFSAVAFNMTEPNKVSKIVETEFGFHIIQLIEKRGDRVRARHILRKPEVPIESLNASMHYLDSLAGEIRSGKISFNDAVAFSADKNTRKNFGLMSNDQTLSSRFELQDLPQEVAKVVYEMEVDEVSAPFMMIDPKTGKDICAIVKLKNRIEGHKATPTEDFQVIKEVMEGKMRQEKLEAWIKEKQKTTYVRINENWRDCEFMYPGWGQN